MLRRDAGLAFHGGSWVFPGGRVDEDELRSAGRDDLIAARSAAVREAREEAGLELAVNDLVTLSHWTTPFGRNRRFATWFFVAGCAPDAEVTIDDGEIRAFEWHPVAEAIAGCESGDIRLAGPTYVSLLRIRPLHTVAEVLHYVRHRPNEVFAPRLLRDGETTYSVYQGDTSFESGRLDDPGPRHRMQMLTVGFRYINDLDPFEG